MLTRYFNFEKLISLGPVQTSNFTCTESNANEQEQ